MKSISEPGVNISKLWGKQPPKSYEIYRLNKYVLSVKHSGITALHNNITGQLVLLDDEETSIINSLPAGYCNEMNLLIANHFLVPIDYDEHKQVVNLRNILRKVKPSNKSITHYTILPTTACNARCYYCFEQGSKIVTMTEETADDTIKFIADSCGEDKHITIIWFGGEPTVAANRIDQICRGLQAEGISYSSMMYTNGYLFDEEMVENARNLWHLSSVQMSIDGTEQIYNRIKAFVNAKDNPYQRVFRNIGYMLEHDISVAVRMNVDYVNHQNFADLVQDFVESYGGNDRLYLCAYPLIGEYADHDGVVNHADENWINEKVQELNLIAKENGFIRPSDSLPSLILNSCMGDNESAITIGADGNLVECAEQYQEEAVVGNVTKGVTDFKKVYEWRQISENNQCVECSFFPNCIKLAKCSAADHCYRGGKNQQYIWNIQYLIDQYFKKEGNEHEI